MPVVVALAAVGVALLLLLVAYALSVLFTPIIEGVLKQVPFVGGVLANKAKGALDWASGKVIGYANTGLHTLVSWFNGLTGAYGDFVDAVNAFIVGLPDQLYHLLHVSVHDVVKSFVNPIRDAANAAQTDATSALSQLSAIDDLPLSHFKGIDAGVETALDRLHTLVRNVDLPHVLDQATTAAGGLFDAAEGDIADLRDVVVGDVGALWDFIGRIPLDELIALLTAVPALVGLVELVTTESGLNNEACRSKVKNICSTDPSAWQALLDIAGVALLWGGLAEFVQLTRDFASETLPTIMEAARGG